MYFHNIFERKIICFIDMEPIPVSHNRSQRKTILPLFSNIRFTCSSISSSAPSLWRDTIIKITIIIIIINYLQLALHNCIYINTANSSQHLGNQHVQRKWH